ESTNVHDWRDLAVQDKEKVWASGTKGFVAFVDNQPHMLVVGLDEVINAELAGVFVRPEVVVVVGSRTYAKQVGLVEFAVRELFCITRDLSLDPLEAGGWHYHLLHKSQKPCSGPVDCVALIEATNALTAGVDHDGCSYIVGFLGSAGTGAKGTIFYLDF
ncbi:MAG: hypothetical protein ACTSVD_01760, partial [Candidatus Thorarchaeota archaeon]